MILTAKGTPYTYISKARRWKIGDQIDLNIREPISNKWLFLAKASITSYKKIGTKYEYTIEYKDIE